jgi:hypothetical protein
VSNMRFALFLARLCLIGIGWTMCVVNAEVHRYTEAFLWLCVSVYGYFAVEYDSREKKP